MELEEADQSLGATEVVRAVLLYTVPHLDRTVAGAWAGRGARGVVNREHLITSLPVASRVDEGSKVIDTTGPK